MSTDATLSRLGQVSMPVRDLDRAVAFYRDQLGIPFLFTAPPGLAFFDCGGTRLMLSSAEGDTGATHVGSILYFDVPDIGGTHAKLASRGVTFDAAPHLIAKLPDREVWMAFFKDPEGNTLALMSEPRR